MMHYKEVIVPALQESVKQVLDKTTCDLCEKAVTKEKYSEEGVTIEFKTGEVYPEGGVGEIVSVDMCPDCFKTKLVPWLEEQGCEPTIADWAV